MSFESSLRLWLVTALAFDLRWVLDTYKNKVIASIVILGREEIGVTAM